MMTIEKYTAEEKRQELEVLRGKRDYLIETKDYCNKVAIRENRPNLYRRKMDALNAEIKRVINIKPVKGV